MQDVIKLRKGDTYVLKDVKYVSTCNLSVYNDLTNIKVTLDKRLRQIRKSFKIGDKISGYCNGYFGMDSYGTKTCIDASRKYAVFKKENSAVGVILQYPEDKELFWSYVQTWRVE